MQAGTKGDHTFSFLLFKWEKFPDQSLTNEGCGHYYAYCHY